MITPYFYTKLKYNSRLKCRNKRKTDEYNIYSCFKNIKIYSILENIASTIGDRPKYLIHSLSIDPSSIHPSIHPSIRLPEIGYVAKQLKKGSKFFCSVCGRAHSLFHCFTNRLTFTLNSLLACIWIFSCMKPRTHTGSQTLRSPDAQTPASSVSLFLLFAYHSY